MAKDYIPRGKNEFFTFQQALVTTITNNAAAWNLPAADVSDLSGASAEYTTLYTITGNKKNCTATQREEHNKFRTAYEKQIRKFVNRFLRDNPDTNAAVLHSAGIKQMGKLRRSRAAITVGVDLSGKAMEGCRVKFSCCIPHHDGGASLHPEADAVEIRYSLDKRPAHADECPHSIIIKKAHPVLEFDYAMLGKYVYAFARWVNLSKANHSGQYGNMFTVMLH